MTGFGALRGFGGFGADRSGGGAIMDSRVGGIGGGAGAVGLGTAAARLDPLVQTGAAEEGRFAGSCGASRCHSLRFTNTSTEIRKLLSFCEA